MRKSASVAVLAFVALGSLPASGETLTLQEGVAAYSGCTDSYINSYYCITNFDGGASPSALSLSGYRYGS